MQCKNPCLVIGTCTIVSLFVDVPRVLGGPETCAQNGGPEVCVRFDNLASAPQVGVDVEFDLSSDPQNPTVQLLRGRDPQGALYAWRVWSWDAQENPANIGSISSPGEYDYSVTILQPDDEHPGADNVALIDLQPGDPSNWSNLPAGEISGNLSGGLTLQESGGQGANLSLTI